MAPLNSLIALIFGNATTSFIDINVAPSISTTATTPSVNALRTRPSTIPPITYSTSSLWASTTLTLPVNPVPTTYDLSVDENETATLWLITGSGANESEPTSPKLTALEISVPVTLLQKVCSFLDEEILQWEQEHLWREGNLWTATTTTDIDSSSSSFFSASTPDTRSPSASPSAENSHGVANSPTTITLPSSEPTNYRMRLAGMNNATLSYVLGKNELELDIPIDIPFLMDSCIKFPVLMEKELLRTDTETASVTTKLSESSSNGSLVQSTEEMTDGIPIPTWTTGELRTVYVIASGEFSSSTKKSEPATPSISNGSISTTERSAPSTSNPTNSTVKFSSVLRPVSVVDGSLTSTRTSLKFPSLFPNATSSTKTVSSSQEQNTINQSDTPRNDSFIDLSSTTTLYEPTRPFLGLERAKPGTEDSQLHAKNDVPNTEGHPGTQDFLSTPPSPFPTTSDSTNAAIPRIPRSREWWHGSWSIFTPTKSIPPRPPITFRPEKRTRLPEPDQPKAERAIDTGANLQRRYNIDELLSVFEPKPSTTSQTITSINTSPTQKYGHLLSIFQPKPSSTETSAGATTETSLTQQTPGPPPSSESDTPLPQLTLGTQNIPTTSKPPQKNPEFTLHNPSLETKPPSPITNSKITPTPFVPIRLPTDQAPANPGHVILPNSSSELPIPRAISWMAWAHVAGIPVVGLWQFMRFLREDVQWGWWIGVALSRGWERMGWDGWRVAYPEFDEVVAPRIVEKLP